MMWNTDWQTGWMCGSEWGGLTSWPRKLKYGKNSNEKSFTLTFSKNRHRFLMYWSPYLNNASRSNITIFTFTNFPAQHYPNLCLLKIPACRDLICWDRTGLKTYPGNDTGNLRWTWVHHDMDQTHKYKQNPFLQVRHFDGGLVHGIC